MRRNTSRLLLPAYLLTSWATAAALAQAPEPLRLEAENPRVEAPDKAKARCRIRVSSEQTGRGKSFSATEVLDLELQVLLSSAVRGEHLLRVAVSTPQGHLYQTLTVPFTTDPAPAKALRAVDGFPRPLAVQQTRPVPEDGKSLGEKAAQAVTARLPVAGTSIVHSSLYGEWTAEAYLDDEIESCGKARTFSIRQ